MSDLMEPSVKNRSKSNNYEPDSVRPKNANANADFLAIVNDEGQYSIWPNRRVIPDGWNIAGMSGTRQECLDYISDNWNDMRPKSLREHMATHSSDTAEVRRDWW